MRAQQIWKCYITHYRRRAKRGGENLLYHTLQRAKRAPEICYITHSAREARRWKLLWTWLIFLFQFSKMLLHSSPWLSLQNTDDETDLFCYHGDKSSPTLNLTGFSAGLTISDLAVSCSKNLMTLLWGIFYHHGKVWVIWCYFVF